MKVDSGMGRALPTARNTVCTGTQVAAVLVVLLAIFTLPCCPRVDGWFGIAQANAVEVEVVQTTTNHAGHDHHASVTTGDDDASGLHKGHLMSTGSVDVLPALSPFALAALLPLSWMGATRVATVVSSPAPRIPVPPPRVAS